MRSSDERFGNIWFPFSYYQDTIDYPPVVIERGAGIYLYDASGKSYLDAVGSWWVNILGHTNPEISLAVKAQVDKLEHVMMAGFVAPPALEVAEHLTAMLPAGLTRVFFSDDGSTAVEAALKIALQYWALKGEQRCEFAALGGGYHGDTLGAMSVGAIPAYHTLCHERFKKQHFVNSPYCYRCPVGREPESCAAECMDSLEALLDEKAGSLAACIFEPMVQCAAGMRIYPVKVLDRIFRLCGEHGVLTIADEVAVGFGRTGRLFACEHAGATPDIVCLGKGLTGGYSPLAATVVKEEIFREFRGDWASGRILQHGHSFTGNPLAAAAAAATLTIIRRDGIPGSLDGKMARFREGLRGFAQFACVGDIRSIGMIGALELVADRRTKAPLPKERRVAFHIARRALELGLLIRPLGDVIYFMPAYVIADEEIDLMFDLAKRALREVVYG